jgi:hypothetical protein
MRVRERGQHVVPRLAHLVVEVVEDDLLPGAQNLFWWQRERRHGPAS